MKPIGNIARHVDLTRPFTQDDITRALARAKSAERPASIRQVAKAGYGLEFLRPSIVANACGAKLPTLPHFVKE